MPLRNAIMSLMLPVAGVACADDSYLGGTIDGAELQLGAPVVSINDYHDADWDVNEFRISATVREAECVSVCRTFVLNLRLEKSMAAAAADGDRVVLLNLTGSVKAGGTATSPAVVFTLEHTGREMGPVQGTLRIGSISKGGFPSSTAYDADFGLSLSYHGDLPGTPAVESETTFGGALLGVELKSTGGFMDLGQGPPKIVWGVHGGSGLAPR